MHKNAFILACIAGNVEYVHGNVTRVPKRVRELGILLAIRNGHGHLVRKTLSHVPPSRNFAVLSTNYALENSDVGLAISLAKKGRGALAERDILSILKDEHDTDINRVKTLIDQSKVSHSLVTESYTNGYIVDILRENVKKDFFLAQIEALGKKRGRGEQYTFAKKEEEEEGEEVVERPWKRRKRMELDDLIREETRDFVGYMNIYTDTFNDEIADDLEFGTEGVLGLPLTYVEEDEEEEELEGENRRKWFLRKQHAEREKIIARKRADVLLAQKEKEQVHRVNSKLIDIFYNNQAKESAISRDVESYTKQTRKLIEIRKQLGIHFEIPHMEGPIGVNTKQLTQRNYLSEVKYSSDDVKRYRRELWAMQKNRLESLYDKIVYIIKHLHHITPKRDYVPVKAKYSMFRMHFRRTLEYMNKYVMSDLDIPGKGMEKVEYRVWEWETSNWNKPGYARDFFTFLGSPVPKVDAYKWDLYMIEVRKQSRRKISEPFIKNIKYKLQELHKVKSRLLVDVKEEREEIRKDLTGKIMDFRYPRGISSPRLNIAIERMQQREERLRKRLRRDDGPD